VGIPGVRIGRTRSICANANRAYCIILGLIQRGIVEVNARYNGVQVRLKIFLTSRKLFCDSG
jgi:hypothetical protein